MFRKLFAILLCLLLLLCVGCADAEEPISPKAEADSTEPTSETEQLSDTGLTRPTEESTEPEPSETEEVTEPPTEEVFAPIDAENPVVEAFAGTYTTGGGSVYEYEYHYSIPQIQCESTYAQSANQELAGFYYDYIDEEGYYGGNISFDWYVNGDVLSIVVYHYNTESPTDYEVDFLNTIYNLRMSDGSKVTYDEILELAGVTKDDFRARAQQILGNAYILKSISPAVAEGIYNDLLETGEVGEGKWMYEYFCKGVSDENLDLIEMFLGEDGALHFTGRRYHTAGGFEYSTPLFDYFADFEVSPYFDTFFASVP